MKTLSLQGLNETSIQIKGFGLNTQVDCVSMGKCPGSFLVTSNNMSASVRVYAIYEDGWVFAMASTKSSKNQVPLSYYMDQTWSKNGHAHVEIHFPDDSKLELEGEFAEVEDTGNED